LLLLLSSDWQLLHCISVGRLVLCHTCRLLWCFHVWKLRLHFFHVFWNKNTSLQDVEYDLPEKHTSENLSHQGSVATDTMTMTYSEQNQLLRHWQMFGKHVKITYVYDDAIFTSLAPNLPCSSLPLFHFFTRRSWPLFQKKNVKKNYQQRFHFVCDIPSSPKHALSLVS